MSASPIFAALAARDPESLFDAPGEIARAILAE